MNKNMILAEISKDNVGSFSQITTETSRNDTYALIEVKA